MTEQRADVPYPYIQLEVPAGTSGGDVLLAMFFGPPVSAAPAGWDALQSVAANAVNVAGTPPPIHAHAYVRVAGASEPATYTWDFTEGGACGGAIVRYPDANPVSPVARVAGGVFGHSWSVGSPPAEIADAESTSVALYVAASDTAAWFPRQDLNPAHGVTQRYLGGFYNRYGTPSRHAQWVAMIADRTTLRAQSDGLGTATSPGGAGFNRRASIFVRLRHVFAPDAPTLLAPEHGDSRDLESGPSFSWRFEDQDLVDAQSAYAFKRNDGDVDEWWDAAASTWATSEVWNSSSHTTVTFPPAAWSNAGSYTWTVATRDAVGNTGPYAEPFEVSGGSAPAVAVTGPASPVATTARPIVEWEYTDAGSSPQSRAEVRVYPAGQVAQPNFSPDDASTSVWQSGWENGDHASRLVGASLVDGDWVAFVRVRNAAGVTTTWESLAFTVTVEAPESPTVAALPEPQHARVRVSVTGQGSGWWVGAERFQVEGSDDGATWFPVGLPVHAGFEREATVLDYTARSRVARSYRARTVADAGGRDVVSAPGDSVSAALELVEWWLTDLADPAGQVGLFLEDEPALFTRPAEEGEFEALGRRNTVVVSGVRKGMRAEFAALFFDAPSYDAYEALLDRRRAVLLRDDMGGAWRVWITQPSDTELLSTADRVDRPMRRVRIVAVEVD